MKYLVLLLLMLTSCVGAYPISQRSTSYLMPRTNQPFSRSYINVMTGDLETHFLVPGGYMDIHGNMFYKTLCCD